MNHETLTRTVRLIETLDKYVKGGVIGEREKENLEDGPALIRTILAGAEEKRKQLVEIAQTEFNTLLASAITTIGANLVRIHFKRSEARPDKNSAIAFLDILHPAIEGFLCQCGILVKNLGPAKELGKVIVWNERLEQYMRSRNIIPRDDVACWEIGAETLNEMSIRIRYHQMPELMMRQGTERPTLIPKDFSMRNRTDWPYGT